MKNKMNQFGSTILTGGQCIGTAVRKLAWIGTVCVGARQEPHRAWVDSLANVHSILYEFVFIRVGV